MVFFLYHCVRFFDVFVFLFGVFLCEWYLRLVFLCFLRVGECTNRVCACLLRGITRQFVYDRGFSLRGAYCSRHAIVA